MFLSFSNTRCSDLTTMMFNRVGGPLHVECVVCTRQCKPVSTARLLTAREKTRTAHQTYRPLVTSRALSDAQNPICWFNLCSRAKYTRWDSESISGLKVVARFLLWKGLWVVWYRGTLFDWNVVTQGRVLWQWLTGDIQRGVARQSPLCLPSMYNNVNTESAIPDV